MSYNFYIVFANVSNVGILAVRGNSWVRKNSKKHSGGAVINMKKLFPFLMIVSVMGAILAGCGAKTEEAAGGEAPAAGAEKPADAEATK